MRVQTFAICVLLAALATFGATRLEANLCLLEGRSGVELFLTGRIPSRSGIERVFATRACARENGRRAAAAKELGLVHLTLLQRERDGSGRGGTSARLAAAAFTEHLALQPANATAWLGLAYAQAVSGQRAASRSSLAAADLLAPGTAELAALRQRTITLLEPNGSAPAAVLP